MTPEEREGFKNWWYKFEAWRFEWTSKAVQEGLPIRPHYTTLDEDLAPYATWFGNAPQGPEPARMGAGYDPDEDKVYCHVVAGHKAGPQPEFDGDGLACYRRYLEINGWA